MEKLGKLFGSLNRVKIMRFFILNKDQGFEVSDITLKLKIKKELVRKEISVLNSAGFIKNKSFIKESTDTKGKSKKKKVQGWFLNQAFPQLEVFNVLIVGSSMIQKEEISSRFKGAGKIKFLAVSGVFIQSPTSRVDLIIIGDSLKRELIEKIVKVLESEIGKDLVYAVFDTPEFTYRHDMRDKLIYDIFDQPHEAVIDLLGVKNLLKRY